MGGTKTSEMVNIGEHTQEITSLTRKQRQCMDEPQVVLCFCSRLSNLKENKHLRKHLKVVKALHFQQGVGFPYIHFPEHCEQLLENVLKTSK